MRAAPRNARVHTKKQIHQIAASIAEFGFNNPALVDEHNNIIAGHGRVQAARVLGLEIIPTIRLEHLTEAQKRAYVIADNMACTRFRRHRVSVFNGVGGV